MARQRGLKAAIAIGKLIAAAGFAASCDSSATTAPDAAAATADAGPVVCDDLPAGISSGRFGADIDHDTVAVRRLVLMGGGAEVDAAARQFVTAAAGGDVLVLRASGSVDSYTVYFGSELGCNPAPASTTTLRTDDVTAAADPAVSCRVAQAEAIWLAGGDQWDYLGRWPSLLQQALAVAGARSAFGGTSAGAMALGEYAFDAEQGTVDSADALAQPLASAVSVQRSPLGQAELARTVVDTHFTQRDREGRLLVFAARALVALATSPVVAVGLDESAALVIEGGAFAVLSDGGAAVWIYRVAGPAQLAAGAPLGLAGVQRVQLSSGDGGAWPIDFAAWPLTDMEVVAGVIQVR